MLAHNIKVFSWLDNQRYQLSLDASSEGVQPSIDLLETFLAEMKAAPPRNNLDVARYISITMDYSETFTTTQEQMDRFTAALQPLVRSGRTKGYVVRMNSN